MNSFFFNNLLLLEMGSTRPSDGIGVFKPLYWLFGVCMDLLMEMFDNRYFVAIIIITIITRLLLLPLNVKQQKSLAKTTGLQPKIQKIQKKYPDPRDRQKLNEEMQELYSREGHNPMQMGCGPMLFQMIFLMGIIGIVYYPISYVIMWRVGIFNNSFIENNDAIFKVVSEFLGTDKIANYQLKILENIGNPDFVNTLQTSFPDIFTNEMCTKLQTYSEGMLLFGLDFTAIPHWKTETGSFNTLVIIPLLCLATSLASTVISTLIQKKNNPAASQQMGQMTIMMLMMPFFSFYIAFQVPAAVGFYWIVSNVVAILQQLYMAKIHPPKKVQAHLMVENTIERRSREENIKKINN